MRRSLLTLSLAFLPLVALPAAAQNNPVNAVTGEARAQSPNLTPGTTPPPVPGPLATHAAQGAQVYYLGQYDQLDGWMMVRAGQPEFYYATPGNRALVMGLLFAPNGDLLTPEQLKSLDLSKQSGILDLMASQLKPVTEAPITPSEFDRADAQPAPAPVQEPVQNPVQAQLEFPTQTPAPASAQTAEAPKKVPGIPGRPETYPPLGSPENPMPKLPLVMPFHENNVMLVDPVRPTPPASQLNAVADVVEAVTPATRLYREMQTATSLSWGQGNTPVMYALIDPNCTHCQAFLREAEPLVNAGRFAVKIIPVGFDDKSKRQSSFALATSGGVGRLLDYAKGDVDALPAPEGINVQAVLANTLLVSKWNLMATPILIYKAANTGEVKLVRGRPSNLDAVISELRGE